MSTPAPWPVVPADLRLPSLDTAPSRAWQAAVEVLGDLRQRLAAAGLSPARRAALQPGLDAMEGELFALRRGLAAGPAFLTHLASTEATFAAYNR